jgi:predicted small lipoprotein YifL
MVWHSRLVQPARRTRSAVPGAFALAAVMALAACGDQGPSTPRPATIEVVSDQQQGAPGTALSQPLVVRVLDAQGGVVVGADVAFTTTGGGSFSPAIARTAADGRAQTVWTLGPGTGLQTATATVGTVTATATATAATVTVACDRVTDHTIGATVNGTLATTSCLLDGFYTDRYRFTLTQETTLQLRQQSQTYGSYLEIYDSNSRFVAFAESQEPGATAQIRAILPAGTYEVWPSTYDLQVTGAYTLTSAVVAAAYAGCADVWIRPGIQTTQTLVPECQFRLDDVLTSGNATYFWLQGGVNRTLTQSSSTGSTRMIVFRLNPQTGFEIVHDSQAAQGAPAVYTFAAQTTLYAVLSAETTAGAGGSYTLGLQ